MVRTTQQGVKIALAINMKNGKAVDNFNISYTSDNKYILTAAKNEGVGFDTPLDLIEYYRVCFSISFELKLLSGTSATEQNSTEERDQTTTLADSPSKYPILDREQNGLRKLQ